MHRYDRRFLRFVLLAVAAAISLQAGASPPPAPRTPVTRVAAPVAAAPAVAQAARAAAPPTKSPPESVCNMLAPVPLLLQHAYARQTVTRKADNEMRETALLDNGVRLEILQSSCVDFASAELIFIVPGRTAPARTDDGWIDFARGAIARMKTRTPASELAGIDEFLTRSLALSSDQGERGVCNDATVAAPGQCSWESTGGFVVSVKHSGKHMRVAVIKYVSI